MILNITMSSVDQRYMLKTETYLYENSFGLLLTSCDTILGGVDFMSSFIMYEEDP